MLFGNTNSHFDLAHDVIFSHQKELVAQETLISNAVNAVLGPL